MNPWNTIRLPRVTFAAAVLAGKRVAALASLVVGFVVFSWSRSVLGQQDAPRFGGVIGLAAWWPTSTS